MGTLFSWELQNQKTGFDSKKNVENFHKKQGTKMQMQKDHPFSTYAKF